MLFNLRWYCHYVLALTQLENIFRLLREYQDTLDLLSAPLFG